MTQRRNHMAAYYSPPPYLGSAGYSPAQTGGYQPANYFGDVKDWFGQNWQNVPLYANPLMPLVPFPQTNVAPAYTAGAVAAQTLETGASAAGHAVVEPVVEFAKGALRGIGIYIGLGIVAYTLLTSRNQ